MEHHGCSVSRFHPIQIVLTQKDRSVAFAQCVAEFSQVYTPATLQLNGSHRHALLDAACLLSKTRSRRSGGEDVPRVSWRASYIGNTDSVLSDTDQGRHMQSASPGPPK